MGLYNPSYSDVETMHDGEEFFSHLSITSHHIFLTFHKQVRYALPGTAVARCAVPVPVE